MLFYGHEKNIHRSDSPLSPLKASGVVGGWKLRDKRSAVVWLGLKRAYLLIEYYSSAQICALDSLPALVSTDRCVSSPILLTRNWNHNSRIRFLSCFGTHRPRSRCDRSCVLPTRLWDYGSRNCLLRTVANRRLCSFFISDVSPNLI